MPEPSASMGPKCRARGKGRIPLRPYFSTSYLTPAAACGLQVLAGATQGCPPTSWRQLLGASWLARAPARTMTLLIRLQPMPSPTARSRPSTTSWTRSPTSMSMAVPAMGSWTRTPTTTMRPIRAACWTPTPPSWTATSPAQPSPAPMVAQTVSKPLAAAFGLHHAPAAHPLDHRWVRWAWWSHSCMLFAICTVG